MDKGGRLSPMRHAASRWNTLSNSKIKSIQCRVGNDGIHHHPRISFYCFHSLARRPTGQFFSFTHTPVKICSTLCGFTRKLCMSSSTVGVLVDCSRDSRPAFIHSDGRGGKDSLVDSLILLLGLSAAFLSVLWSSHRTTAPLTPSGILYTNLGLSWLRLSTPRSFVLPLPHHGHHRPSSHARIVSCKVLAFPDAFKTASTASASASYPDNRLPTELLLSSCFFVFFFHETTLFSTSILLPSLPNHHRNTIANLTPPVHTTFVFPNPKITFKESIRIQSHCTIIILR